MLIRWATNEDIPSWTRLAENVSDIFGSPTMSTDKEFLDYMAGKLSKYEALIAVDRMTGNCLGIIGFSRTHNRISWFGVFEDQRGLGIGTRLLRCALRQLDNTKEITVVTFRADYFPGLRARAVYQKLGFIETDNTLSDHLGNLRCKMTITPTNERHGSSFHHRYLDYAKYSQADFCLFCNHHPAPENHVEIAEFEHSFAYIERLAQGRLFGKGYVIPKVHVVDFEEMPKGSMIGFMSDIQTTAKALHRITGAVKINFEMHANSGPHLHCHLFPRYLDDDFPGISIDYHLTEPSPYESEAEFEWFVERMREELRVKHA